MKAVWLLGTPRGTAQSSLQIKRRLLTLLSSFGGSDRGTGGDVTFLDWGGICIGRGGGCEQIKPPYLKKGRRIRPSTAIAVIAGRASYVCVHGVMKPKGAHASEAGQPVTGRRENDTPPEK